MSIVHDSSRFYVETYFDTLRVHLVILLWSRPIQTSIPFLADEQVREVDFLELEFDWFNELCGNKLRRLTAFDND